MFDAPVVLVFGLALPGEHGDACRGDGGGCVVLRGEDVARRPCHLGAEGCEGLDEDGCLDGCAEGETVSEGSSHLFSGGAKRTHM